MGLFAESTESLNNQTLGRETQCISEIPGNRLETPVSRVPLGEESAPPGFCSGVIVPNLQGMRVPWVCLGSCAHFMTRRGGTLLDSVIQDKCEKRGGPPRSTRDDTVHKE